MASPDSPARCTAGGDRTVHPRIGAIHQPGTPADPTSAPVPVYREGETLDITIRGRVVEDSDKRWCLRIAFRQPEELRADPYPLILPLRSPDMTVERVAPAEWPPRAGDLWTDHDGRPWFAVDVSDGDEDPHVELQGVSTHTHGRMAPDEVNRVCGPMTLARRFEKPPTDAEHPQGGGGES